MPLCANTFAGTLLSNRGSMPARFIFRTEYSTRGRTYAPLSGSDRKQGIVYAYGRQRSIHSPVQVDCLRNSAARSKWACNRPRRAEYSSDLQPDAMLHGQVVRPPNYRCRLLSYDASTAAKLPGVKIVHQGDFLGVIAPTKQAAATAARAIEVRWSSEQLGDPDTLFSDLKRNAKPPDAKAAAGIRH